LVGPVLIVPYVHRTEVSEWTESNGKRLLEKKIHETKAEAIFLPERLEINGTIDPSTRQRGIYITHVFTAKAVLKGRFAKPDLGFLGLEGIEPQWKFARVEVGVSDLRGVRETITLRWGANSVAMQPGISCCGSKTGVYAPVVISEGDGTEFALDLNLNGSTGFKVVPLGKETQVRLASSWADPSFNGAFLPTQRQVSAKGFEASWEVSFYGRNFPQQWSYRHSERPPKESEFAAAAFGVELMENINAYRVIERAIKYGVLFIALVFATFFLFEAASGLRLNALNYLLVGAALCLFYLGLLALAEFWRFGAAYCVAAVASLSLVGSYSTAILRTRSRAFLVCGLLALVYGYLYLILQLEDYALLAGTVALFMALAAVMWVTRHIKSAP